MSDYIEFKIKGIKSDKKKYFILIKGAISQEDIIAMIIEMLKHKIEIYKVNPDSITSIN